MRVDSWVEVAAGTVLRASVGDALASAGPCMSLDAVVLLQAVSFAAVAADAAADSLNGSLA